jgi:hypothetical protein
MVAYKTHTSLAVAQMSASLDASARGGCKIGSNKETSIAEESARCSDSA